jgi:nucleotide-binding universal stress UspA family protein
MSGIVCAVRGGPASQPTIDRAIALAKETGLPLSFLYVVNLDFLDYTQSSRVQTITHELQQMGEFILLTAQTRAAAQGIQSEGVVRHGRVAQEVSQLCREMQAEYLVIGQPKFHLEESVFTRDLLGEFIGRVEEQTGARVILPEESSNG